MDIIVPVLDRKDSKYAIWAYAVGLASCVLTAKLQLTWRDPSGVHRIPGLGTCMEVQE